MQDSPAYTMERNNIADKIMRRTFTVLEGLFELWNNVNIYKKNKRNGNQKEQETN